MSVFEIPLQIRWSDLDPNFHLRHSVYYDWGALCRTEFLIGHGLTPALMQKLQFGPVIFREEAVFRKEIRFGDPVKVNLRLVSAKRDFSRWTIRHEIIKGDDTVCSTLTIDGAWINLVERKLFIPPDEAVAVFRQMPGIELVEWKD